MKMNKLKNKKIQKTKLHAIPRFPAGIINFAVYIGNHLQFGIICGPVWGSFPYDDHLRSGIMICRTVQNVFRS